MEISSNNEITYSVSYRGDQLIKPSKILMKINDNLPGGKEGLLLGYKPEVTKSERKV